jgi:lipoprotein-anchoring transpeptidase ErfK/SrfK
VSSMSNHVRLSATLLAFALISGATFTSLLGPAPALAQSAAIIVKTHARQLQLMYGNQRVKTYPVAVGKAGKKWYGTTMIARKMIRPPWVPPPEVKRDKPYLPNYIKGGAHNNPMGAAALLLGSGKYAIHGTNRPSSIGTFASYGCIRMHNRDVLDLYRRVSVGTRVTVVP